jgi:hypothetical protein
LNPTPKLRLMSVSASRSIVGLCSSAQYWIITYCTLKERSINWQTIH